MSVARTHTSKPARKNAIKPFRLQLLKWVGNKQRLAHEIISYFPRDVDAYHEPFLGSGGVLATLAPRKAHATDVFAPLMEIWAALTDSPQKLKRWYSRRRDRLDKEDKTSVYEQVRTSYNAKPNGADLVFLCRSCYGGVVRFRQADGYMSTPCGVHRPISSESFDRRVDEWQARTAGTAFALMDYREAMQRAKKGDMVYCDPPYSHSQAILYGAQSFSLAELFEAVESCKRRGVRVALSIDGSKRSGSVECELSIPEGLFQREAYVNCGRSMLKRFQMNGRTLENEKVADRLLLTY